MNCLCKYLLIVHFGTCMNYRLIEESLSLVQESSHRLTTQIVDVNTRLNTREYPDNNLV